MGWVYRVIKCSCISYYSYYLADRLKTTHNWEFALFSKTKKVLISSCRMRGIHQNIKIPKRYGFNVCRLFRSVRDISWITVAFDPPEIGWMNSFLLDPSPIIALPCLVHSLINEVMLWRLVWWRWSCWYCCWRWNWCWGKRWQQLDNSIFIVWRQIEIVWPHFEVSLFIVCCSWKGGYFVTQHPTLWIRCAFGNVCR